MGDIADAILDGELCQECGVYMGEAVGYAQSCGSCKRESRVPQPASKVACPICKKRVKVTGLNDHMRDAHK